MSKPEEEESLLVASVDPAAAAPAAPARGRGALWWVLVCAATVTAVAAAAGLASAGGWQPAAPIVEAVPAPRTVGELLARAGLPVPTRPYMSPRILQAFPLVAAPNSSWRPPHTERAVFKPCTYLGVKPLPPSRPFACALLGDDVLPLPAPRVVLEAIFFGSEIELLMMRLFEGEGVVTHTFIVEAPFTPSGLPKELIFAKHRAVFQPFLHRITVVTLPSLAQLAAEDPVLATIPGLVEGVDKRPLDQEQRYKMEAYTRENPYLRAAVRAFMAAANGTHSNESVATAVISVVDTDELTHHDLLRALRDCEVGLPVRLAHPSTLYSFRYLQFPDYFPMVHVFVPVRAYLDRVYTANMHTSDLVPQPVLDYVYNPSGKPNTGCCDTQCCGLQPPAWPAGQPQPPALLGDSVQPYYKPYRDEASGDVRFGRFFGYHMSSFMSPLQLYMKMFSYGHADAEALTGAHLKGSVSALEEHVRAYELAILERRNAQGGSAEMLRLVSPAWPNGPYNTPVLMKGQQGPLSEYSMENMSLPEIVFLNMDHDCFRKYLTVDPWWTEEFGLT